MSKLGEKLITSAKETIETLRALSPNKGKNMNAIIDTAVDSTPAISDIKHFVIAIDPETGEEIRIEVQPNGEFSQEAEEAPTLH